MFTPVVVDWDSIGLQFKQGVNRSPNTFPQDVTIAQMEEKPRTTPYPLRMPDELRAQLENAAKNGSRSLHAEIVARLQASFNAMPKDAATRSAPSSEKLEQLESDLQLPTKMIPLVDVEKSLKQYEAHLEEVLAKRDEKMRSWWQKEFGYDPQAPKVDRPPNKGPGPSPNVRKRLPKKP